MDRVVRGYMRLSPFRVLILAFLVMTVLGAPGQSRGLSASAASPTTTLAILHFSVIKGTTWSGAHHRAGQRLAQKYPNVKYVFREEVGPDLTVPYAEELIRQGANIVVGNAEFMGLPLKNIADKYPNVYFASVIASDITAKRNFIRFFPRQYQPFYLQGLLAGALTRTGNIGIVSAFPNVQVLRRQGGFILGAQEAGRVLGKPINIHVKYVGDWYKPTEEREVARTLVSQQRVDVLTHQTDSGSPLDVAQERGIWFMGKDMDIVGFYGWSSTDTVVISYDTRWEVLYDRMIRDFLAGNRNPRTLLYLGMKETMTLADGTVESTVDIMNNKKVGADAISPKARPLIPTSIVNLVRQRRDQMMKGQWDPFTAHALVSNGTGLALQGVPIPAKGTVVKPAGQVPTDEFLLGRFNFDVQGVTILK
ncbi:MAG: BMP family ABC transporter substrate-binding protein [Armatimonadota bacterium]|nr:BMP family ABC transporter substrate-binding protein [Armatimonadota bacterium]